MTKYDSAFYEKHGDTAHRSARAVVPLLIDWLKPRSAVDVGCGTGAWLSVFWEHGVTDILGIDGNWLDQDLLAIPASCFLRRDLTQPIRLERRFDLVMSLEVAEHLSKESAGTFVESLVSLGEFILFSAAIPEQGGRHHVNEQWPDYWIRHFSSHGYETVDCLRPRIWNNPQVEWYYAQNLLVFAHRDRLASMPALPQPDALGNALPLVHPRLFHAKLAELRTWVQQVTALAEDLSRVIPPGASVIMVDEGSFGRLASAGFRVSPFPETHGQYAGRPGNDAAAVQEFERLRDNGAEFMVFAWTAFWWLDQYPGLSERLRAAYPVVLESSRAIVFALGSNASDGSK